MVGFAVQGMGNRDIDRLKTAGGRPSKENKSKGKDK